MHGAFATFGLPEPTRRTEIDEVLWKRFQRKIGYLQIWSEPNVMPTKCVLSQAKQVTVKPTAQPPFKLVGRCLTLAFNQMQIHKY